jgi:hypothetical protein
MGSRRSDFLFANSSFLIGMGTVLNIGGNYFEFNGSKSPAEADARALASDFAVVANDMRAALMEAEDLLNDSSHEPEPARTT